MLSGKPATTQDPTTKATITTKSLYYTHTVFTAAVLNLVYSTSIEQKLRRVNADPYLARDERLDTLVERVALTLDALLQGVSDVLFIG